MAQPSQASGMGAVLTERGAAFRVWAPNAESVSVAGEFNNWDTEANPMAEEGEGYWSADVPEAEVGQRYKFCIGHGGETLWRTDPYARCVDPDNYYEGIIVDPSFDWEDDDFNPPPLNELVLYEFHFGTFAMDEEGANPIQQATAKLPYLKDLGVNAVEVLPPLQFPGEVSWGYDMSYIFAVAESYGRPQDLKQFVKEAHRLGLAVFMDAVYNHLGPKDLQLWRFDGWHEGEGGGIYFYNDFRAKTPWGHTRPDYGREEVRQYLRDSAIFWLSEYRFDGLRLDGVGYMRVVIDDDGGRHELPEGKDMLRWMNHDAHRLDRTKYMIAEDGHNDDWCVLRTPDGGGFDAQWDMWGCHQLREAMMAVSDEERSMEAVRKAIEHRFGDEAFSRVIFTESHDEVANGQARLPYEIDHENAGGWAARKRSTLGAALAMCAPGIAMLFQGQEILKDEWFKDDRPIDWEKLEQYAGIHRFYKDLIHLRRNAGGITRGLQGEHLDVFHVNDEDKVIAFHRWAEGGPGDSVVVIANLANSNLDSYRIGFPAAGRWEVRLNSDSTAYSDDYSDCPGWDVETEDEPFHGQPCSGLIGIGPYSVLIYSQSP